MRVLHVLSSDRARGAQVYAVALAGGLTEPGSEHLTTTLFADPHGSVRDLDVPGTVAEGLLRRAWVDPRARRALRRTVADLAPHVVVCHGLEPLKYLPRHRPGVVALAIGTMAPGARTGLRRGLYRRLLGRAEVVAGVSTEVCDELRALFDVPARLLVNGRDPADFAVRGERDAVPTLVFVGAFVAGKCPELFLQVVAGLRAAGVGFRARMAGSGPLVETLAARAAVLDVELLGHRRDVPAVLAAADLLLFTSRGDGEGMPGVLIEAGLAGVPVVTTAVPGARDVVRDGHTGAVVDVGDTAGLTAACRRLLSDAALRREQGAAARARCVERFGLGQSLTAWRHVIAEAAAAAGPRPSRTQPVPMRGRPG